MNGADSFFGPSRRDIASNDISGNSYHDLNSLNRLRELGQRDKDGALVAAARQFESHFLKTLIKTMREANDALGENDMFDSDNVDFYQEMYDEQLAATLSSKNSLGLADLMIQQLSGLKSAPVNRSPTDHRSSAQYLSTPSVKAADTPKISPANTVSSPLQQQRATQPVEFIKSVLPYAQKAAKALGVPEETILAQSALETGWGKASGGEDGAHRYFGIKAGSSWQGTSSVKPTIEFVAGVPKKTVERFRSYPDIASAFDDYVNYLKSSPRYQAAFQSDGSPKTFAEGLQNGGYATDPSYASKILAIQNGEYFKNVLKEARNLLSISQ